MASKLPRPVIPTFIALLLLGGIDPRGAGAGGLAADVDDVGAEGVWRHRVQGERAHRAPTGVESDVMSTAAFLLGPSGLPAEAGGWPRTSVVHFIG